MELEDLPNENLPDGFWIDEEGVSFERFLCEWGSDSASFNRRKLSMVSVSIDLSEILKAIKIWR